MKKLIAILFLSGSVLFLQAQQKFGLYDLDLIYSLSDPQISPDGKAILIVVSKPDSLINKNRSFIAKVDVATSTTQQLTYDRSPVSHPRWSPSGDAIAFIAPDAAGKGQIYILPTTGGEARRATQSPTGVQQFSWSPDGKQFAFVQEDEVMNKKDVERGYDAFEIGHNSMFQTVKPNPSHIWLANVAGGEAKRQTSGTWSVPVTIPIGPAAGGLSWSPDGKQLVFQSNESPLSGELVFTARILDIETGKISRITNATIDNKQMHRERQPAFSPDGRSVMYQYQLKNVGYGSDVYVKGMNGGAEKNLTASLDRCFFRAEWMPDSKSVLVGANDQNTVALWLQPLEGAARKLALGNLCITGSYGYQYSVGKNNSIAIVASSPQQAPELYLLKDPQSMPVKMTGFNDALKKISFGKQETFSWRSEEFTPNGILTFPPDFDPSKKYPLVLEIHGGPRSSSKEVFNPSAQLKAARGYIVFQPNYRGSDNMGYRFSEAISRDMGEGPGRDVMNGLKELKKRSYIDTNRIAVTGWSYGGFMTTWLIGNYQGWACAMAGAAVTDWFDQYAESDFGSMYQFEYGQGKSPFTDESVKQNWIRNSPITYAQNVSTPTLFISNTGDERVPISETYKYFRVLQDRGIESKFIAFPIPGHIPTDPIRTREMNRFILEWLDKYLK
jgi:dipeptidyl aminopeptidase/acylaminoacyl peptidase